MKNEKRESNKRIKKRNLDQCCTVYSASERSTTALEDAVNAYQGGQDIRIRTFEFAVQIVRLCKELDESPGVRRTLGRQLIRSGTAIGANLEEAQAGYSRAEFAAKYSIALKEARETAYWLRLIAETEPLFAPRFAGLLSECEEIKRSLGAIVVATRKHSR
jgi:four helix bundle protein